ncbi:hypothetical protein N7456_003543 [Penicillium angulare]|uniref:Uncharacterized protein n=1 Tax=Penicillium angulare TaxID=116970 RepID=A0A9W9FUZ5_9EURO|nr:hypothetical protein N7456_003543 [Penicillium angulare]
MQCLLAHRGYDRSTAAIDDMVWHIAVKWPSLRPVNGKWDVRAVDRWIDDQINDHECVNQIIQFSIRDADAVASSLTVSILIKLLSKV